MTAGEELEAALQRGWSFDELEVYADLLLSKNDPRGDVVAIDLSPRPEQHTWVQRRRAALAAWLGNTLAARAGHLVQHGFVHELRDGMYPPELLDSPAGTYVRGYTSWGRARVKPSLERLAARPRPWLSRLVIAHHGNDTLSEAAVRALIAATPRLEDLCIIGRPMFDAFPHPGVRRVRLDARCYGIDVPVEKVRITVADGAPGPAISEDDLDLLMELVELAPDCNQLYTHAAQFDEPLPVLVARLAAAQLVELAGPVVRAATPGLAVRLGRRRVTLEDLDGRRGWIEPDRNYLQIGELGPHGAFIRDCLRTYPISGRLQDSFTEYHRIWRRAANGAVVVDGERLAQFRGAFNALLELRGLWADGVGLAADWELVERLADELVGTNAAFRQYGYYYY